jgi:hypothetical protein
MIIEQVQSMFDGDAVFSAGEKPGPFDIIRTPAIIADLTGTHQVFKHFHQRWSPLERVIAAVEQVQVDALEPQATQAGRACPLNGISLQGPGIRLIRHGIFSEFGRHHDAISMAAQGFTQDALTQTLPVIIRGVKKCHAQIDSRLDLPNSIPFRR